MMEEVFRHSNTSFTTPLNDFPLDQTQPRLTESNFDYDRTTMTFQNSDTETNDLLKSLVNDDHISAMVTQLGMEADDLLGLGPDHLMNLEPWCQLPPPPLPHERHHSPDHKQQNHLGRKGSSDDEALSSSSSNGVGGEHSPLHSPWSTDSGIGSDISNPQSTSVVSTTATDNRWQASNPGNVRSADQDGYFTLHNDHPFYYDEVASAYAHRDQNKATGNEISSMRCIHPKNTNSTIPATATTVAVTNATQLVLMLPPSSSNTACQIAFVPDASVGGVMKRECVSPAVSNCTMMPRVHTSTTMMHFPKIQPKLQQPSVSPTPSDTDSVCSSRIATTPMQRTAMRPATLPVMHSGSPEDKTVDSPEPNDFTARKEQRKIKNREAAQISRNRRKLLVDGMKGELNRQVVENEQLKYENQRLHGLINELTSKNESLFRELQSYKSSTASTVLPTAATSGYGGGAVVMTSAGGKRRLIQQLHSGGAPVAKAATVATVTLMVVMALFVFNMGGSPSIARFIPSDLVSKDKVIHERQVEVFDGGNPSAAAYMANSGAFHSRNLLSTDLENELTWRNQLNERLRRSMEDIKDASEYANKTNLINDCKRLYVNATESLRLNDELSSWFKRHQAMLKSQKSVINDQLRVNLTDNGQKEKKATTLETAATTRRSESLPIRKPKLGNRSQFNGGSPWQQLNRFVNSDRRPHRSPLTADLLDWGEPLYSNLLRALQTRDDTFYLVSLKDFLLLPATSFNSTNGRPRISLIVPTLPLNNTHVLTSSAAQRRSLSMMRIECEVTATSVVHVSESMLFRPPSAQRRSARPTVKEQRRRNETQT